MGGSGASVPIACKEVISATIDPDDLREFQHEARMMTQLHHPYVITFYGVCEKIVTNQHTKEPEVRLYMVTELADGGSLESKIEKAIHMKKLMKTASAKKGMKMPFDGQTMVRWALQIAAGMAHIHGRGFIHRDVKPHNVLLNKSNDALICDLGTVKNLDPDGIGSGITSGELRTKREEDDYDLEAPVSSMTRNLGTPLYMAPEQVLYDQYSNAVDVWAYGIMMVRLFSLGDPYHSSITMRELREEVCTNKVQPNRLKASSLPHPRIKKIVEGCLEFEAEDRYTFEQIEEALSNILNEIEINIQTKKELLDYLKTFSIEDNQHIQKDLGSYYDKFLEQGVECQEDLGLVTREDLINMGLNKHSAKKTVRKFVEIAKITVKKRKEAERKAALTSTLRKKKSFNRGTNEKKQSFNQAGTTMKKKSPDPLTTSLNKSKKSSDRYLNVDPTITLTKEDRHVMKKKRVVAQVGGTQSNTTSRGEVKTDFTTVEIKVDQTSPPQTGTAEPVSELLTYLKSFKKVDKAKHDLGFYYQLFLDEGVETVADLEDVATEDLLDMGLNKISAKKIGKKFAEIGDNKRKLARQNSKNKKKKKKKKKMEERVNLAMTMPSPKSRRY